MDGHETDMVGAALYDQLTEEAAPQTLLHHFDDGAVLGGDEGEAGRDAAALQDTQYLGVHTVGGDEEGAALKGGDGERFGGSFLRRQHRVIGVAEQRVEIQPGGEAVAQEGPRR